MPSAPPRVMEAVVGFLLPPACREHVLGDLHERYTSPRQYLVDALLAVPLVIASRIRRTTDPDVFLMEALGLCKLEHNPKGNRMRAWSVPPDESEDR